MKLRTLVLGLSCCLCGACASTPDPRDVTWEAQRAQISSRNHTGEVSPAEAYRQMKVTYWEIYGEDGNMAAYFAYAQSLLASVDAGYIEDGDARALILDKELEATTKATRDRRLREAYAYPAN